MAIIRADHSRLEKAAAAVDNYVAEHKKNMSDIDASMTELGLAWQGNDYEQLKIQWQQIDSNESTSGKMLQALENYAEFLRFAADKYKTAQVNAVNRAKKLPNW